MPYGGVCLMRSMPYEGSTVPPLRPLSHVKRKDLTGSVLSFDVGKGPTRWYPTCSSHVTPLVRGGHTSSDHL